MFAERILVHGLDGFMLAPPQHNRNGVAELAVLQGFLHRLGNLLRLGLIGLRGGEHHYEEREKQGDEIGVRY